MSNYSVQEMVTPARHHYTVTFSDTQSIASALGFTGQKRPRALKCNAAGNISVVDGNNNAIVYTVVAGDRLDIQADRVNSTNTTVAAGSVIAWY